MRYSDVTEGVFLERPNRFIAIVRTGEEEHRVHVPNTGRCRELLVPGSRVFLSRSGNPDRVTKYDLVAVMKERDDTDPILVNIDSQAPNRAAGEWLRGGGLLPKGATVRGEVKHGDSRFDFCAEYGEKKAFIEVKGVTLEQGGVAMFPDAPTERGLKHLRGLAAAVKEGFDACVLFVVQMKGPRLFRPNDATDPAFGEALREARRAGVKVIAVDCAVTPDSMEIDRKIEVEL